MNRPDPWHARLRRFKEKLAERLWALPTLSEAEKEIVFREYLGDLDDLETDLARMQDDAAASARTAGEENDLLRSLMGVPGDELKVRTLALGEDLRAAQDSLGRRDEELAELRERLMTANEENDVLRQRIQEFESNVDLFRAEQIRQRENDVRYFSETHAALKDQVKDLETRLANLRELFTASNKALVAEKQEEISLLQKKLLDEMEQTLRRGQEIAWAEEEAFAKGVAHRVRTALVSAQGQLLLTLERLGLMDPQSKTEAFWKSRIRLFVDGADELADNFRSVEALLQEVTSSLDDYLHLTSRREIARAPVGLSDLVRAEIASLYGERQPTLKLDVLSDDPLPDVRGDPQLLTFVVRELIRNAVEALPNRAGEVVIALKHIAPRGVVQVLVRDTGVGVPSHLQAKLFQPFFTTKDGRQGLSLSRARRYVEFHGGTLELLESATTGSLFQIELPIADRAPTGGFAAITRVSPRPEGF